VHSDFLVTSREATQILTQIHFCTPCHDIIRAKDSARTCSSPRVGFVNHAQRRRQELSDEQHQKHAPARLRTQRFSHSSEMFLTPNPSSSQTCTRDLTWQAARQTRGASHGVLDLNHEPRDFRVVFILFHCSWTTCWPTHTNTPTPTETETNRQQDREMSSDRHRERVRDRETQRYTGTQTHV